MTITAAQADRIEEKLDMIMEHFSIGDSVPRSPVELIELARKSVANDRARRDRRVRGKAKAKVIPYEQVNRQAGAKEGAG